MGSLINRITNITEATYGVNILEKSPPQNVRGEPTNVVGVVGDFPWGPYDVTTIASTSEFYETFAPTSFDVLDDYPSLKAMLNKTFPGPIEIKRVAVTSAAAATLDFDDTDGTESVTVTANYNGAVGNSINIEWVAGSTGATTSMTAIVTIGTLYSRTYVDVVSGTTTVTDPGDPYVTFSAHASMVKTPVAVGATALATGSDGTAVSADWTGVPGTDFDGISAFEDDNTAATVLFGAEVPASFIAAFNTALASVCDNAGVTGWASTVAGATRAEVITATGLVTESDRVYVCWPRVKMTNYFDPDAATVTVDGNAFAAVATASVLPEQSPAGKPGRFRLQGITGLETSISKGDYALLDAAGINGFFSSRYGYILRQGYTTSAESGKELICRRRMTDYITSSLAAYFENFIGELLDIDITNARFGPITGPEAGGAEEFLRTLKDDGRIKDYSIEWFSGNTTQIQSGIWPIVLSVTLFAPQQKIVLIANIGQTVQIQEAA